MAARAWQHCLIQMTAVAVAVRASVYANSSAHRHPPHAAPRYLTGAIEEVSETSGVNQAFLGLIVLPIAGNACEHITGGWWVGGWVVAAPGSACCPATSAKL